MTVTAEAKVKETGLIFTAESIRAILADEKTQTRRIAWEFDIHHKIRKSQPDAPVKWAGAVLPARESGWMSWYPGDANSKINGLTLAEFTKKQYAKGINFRYGGPGDRLYAKEAAYIDREVLPEIGCLRAFYADSNLCVFQDGRHGSAPYMPSAEILDLNASLKKVNPLFMPRWASRLLLEVVRIRPERLHDITEEDAIAEGITEPLPAHGGEWCDPAKGRQGHWSYRKAFSVKWDEINKRRSPWNDNGWVWRIEFKRL